VSPGNAPKQETEQKAPIQNLAPAEVYSIIGGITGVQFIDEVGVLKVCDGMKLRAKITAPRMMTAYPAAMNTGDDPGITNAIHRMETNTRQVHKAVAGMRVMGGLPHIGRTVEKPG
jgi:hypothetical protein